MKYSITLFILLTSFLCNAQRPEKTVTVRYISTPITIDGVLDEMPWTEAIPAADFWQFFPTDSIDAEQVSEIRFLFDDENLYVGIKVNAVGDDYIIPSLRRDFRAGGNDNITLMFDTFCDGSNAFLFGTNPYGVLREALISGGGTELRGFNTAWDTKWKGISKIHDTYYIAEWEIPLSAFKYREGETKWRFNSYQFDTQENTRNTWINIPQNQSIFGLAHMGDMIFEKPLGKSKSPVTIIPYINGLTGKDFESDKSSNSFDFGADAKLTIGNSMNLDLTVNPDFSQVEVDQQVTNLTRFEISLPERRQFFIENSDLFADFGNSQDANPFFSRRIGIASDREGNNIENKIVGGLRLSGKLSNNFRIGLLNMQTEEDRENEIPATNNAVLALQQKLFNRSSLSFMFVNKRTTESYDFLENNERYNRVLGIDYRLASADNSWTGKYYLHKSFSPDDDDDSFSSGISTTYNSRYFNLRLSGTYIGDNFRSDLGFIRRTDIIKIDPSVSLSLWPAKGKIQKHSLSITPIFYWRPTLDYFNSDQLIMSTWSASFHSSASLSLSVNNRFTHLYSDFDPTNSDGGIPLPGNSGYRYTSFDLQYRSDQRSKISYNLRASFGDFFNGNKYSISSNISWRLQPYFKGSLQINYDKIKLPSPYSTADLWLIGPRFDLTFNKKLFWATFIQYSGQKENFSINTRLQWRFAPLSDLFLVYNDNYSTINDFSPKTRSFNIKMTYWLNI